jgi:hypothetical protein
MYVKRFVGDFLEPYGPLTTTSLVRTEAKGSGFSPIRHEFLGELVVTEKVADGDWFVAVRARGSRAKPPAPGVAVVAALLPN